MCFCRVIVVFFEVRRIFVGIGEDIGIERYEVFFICIDLGGRRFFDGR